MVNRSLMMNNMTIKTFIVEGMMCKNCSTHVENAIKKNTGIDEVIVDLANGQVRVSGDEIDLIKVKQSVEEAGYKFKGEIDNVGKGSEVWIS
jgi:copper chaperone CopZ